MIVFSLKQADGGGCEGAGRARASVSDRGAAGGASVLAGAYGVQLV